MMVVVSVDNIIDVVTINNMKAKLLLQRRLILSESAFAEMMIWQLQVPLEGSAHDYKYRLAYVVNGVCILRYDNEAGKGNHLHINEQETSYSFVSSEQLLKDFFAQIKRMENSL
ncbi:MAG: DUF6516 family protein [Methylotenera sp.]|nr:DUF6516 family protein [Methylotenera sp.]